MKPFVSSAEIPVNAGSGTARLYALEVPRVRCPSCELIATAHGATIAAHAPTATSQ